MKASKQPLCDDPPPPALQRDVPARAGLIAYDARLIDSLLRDHAELGRLFAQAGVAGTAGNARDARALLITFKARLKAHIVAENTRFYDYLEQTIVEDRETARMVRNYRRKMAGIARHVLAFVHRYQGSAFAPAEREAFGVVHAAVLHELEQRLDSEEDTLYRLYRQA